MQANADKDERIETNPSPKNTKGMIKRAGRSPRLMLLSVCTLLFLHGQCFEGTVARTFAATGAFAVVDSRGGIPFLGQGSGGANTYGRATVALWTSLFLYYKGFDSRVGIGFVSEKS